MFSTKKSHYPILKAASSVHPCIGHNFCQAVMVKNGIKKLFQNKLSIFAPNRNSAISRGKIEAWPFLLFYPIGHSFQHKKSEVDLDKIEGMMAI